ncbi:MAG: type IV pilus modification protein PilV [Porticoccaceae bacterium]
MSCRSRARGATLIEVLIAVLVLAVGILGLMGLQINGKRTNYAALQRSAAVSLAQDMMNRMRANPNVAPTVTFLDTNYDTGSYTGDGVGGGTITTTPKDCAVVDAACSPTQLAAYDLWAWEKQLDDAVTSNGLINPTGCIDVDLSAADGSLVTVIVAWESKIDLDQTALVARMPAGMNCGAGKYGTGDTRRQAVFSTTFLANR